MPGRREAQSLMKMGKIQEMILLLMLAVAAQEDVRTGKISILPPALGAALCVGLQIAAGEFRPGDAALGAGAGGMLAGRLSDTETDCCSPPPAAVWEVRIMCCCFFARS